MKQSRKVELNWSGLSLLECLLYFSCLYLTLVRAVCAVAVVIVFFYVLFSFFSQGKIRSNSRG